MVIGGDYRRLHPTLISRTRTIHGDSSRNRQNARGDGQTESWEADACLKQEGEAAKGEPARQALRNSWPGLSQWRFGGCGRRRHDEVR